MSTTGFLNVDWSRLPAPLDDGAAKHLPGTAVADITLPATDDSAVSLARLAKRTVVYAYPTTGRPGTPLPEGWDEIPGALWMHPRKLRLPRSSCRLDLPFPLLSDAALRLTTELQLPAILVGGATLLKRMALIIDDGVITHVFYPVFPPDRIAGEVLAWLRAQRA
jgi:peroxiredoxin